MDRFHWTRKRIRAQKLKVREDDIKYGDETRNSAACPEGERACPVCGTKMRSRKLDGEVVDVCAAHGQWFDEGELRKLIVAEEKRRSLRYHRQSQWQVDRTIGDTTPVVPLSGTFGGTMTDVYGKFIDALLDSTSPPASLPRVEVGLAHIDSTIEPHANSSIVAEGRRACPICRKPMHSARFHSDVIDRCPEHGFWFDNGELRRFLNVSAARGAKRRALKNRFSATMLDRSRRYGQRRRISFDDII